FHSPNSFRTRSRDSQPRRAPPAQMVHLRSFGILEDPAESLYETILHLGQIQRVPKLTLHGGDLFVRVPARGDGVEPMEVGVHVQRNAVIGDPPSRRYSDTGYFRGTCPHTRPATLEPGL